MGSEKERTETLRSQVERIADKAGAERVAVAFHDYETETEWSYQGEEWFHAASTIKVPVLLGVFGAIEAGEFTLDSRVHVRNRFASAADGSLYRVESGRDANSEVHQAVGKTLRVRELARHMIATSSNLATNVLVDLVGTERIQETLRELCVEGVDFQRGVEDEKAWEAGISNRTTARGLLRLLRLVAEEEAFSPEASRSILEILHTQEFKRGIPAGLPKEARVAHKTGEISTVAHDAGIVFLPERKPYALVVLTEWSVEASGRSEAIASISRSVYEHLTRGEEDG